MKRSPKKSTKPNTASQFSICSRRDGCDETFSVVCLATGHIIASLPYWYQEAETLSDTRLFIRALDRFYQRGGYFFVPQLLEAIRALDPRRDHGGFPSE